MNGGQATVHIPLENIKPLYRNDDTLVVEVPLRVLRAMNDADALDDIISQARLDYVAGDYRSFDKVDDLVADLRS